MRTPFAFIAALLCSGLNAQDPQWATPPKLVVGVVVDQMRVDNIYRYWDNYSEGGFKRLVREGSFQRDAHYDYVPTFTAPGHASIYTGTTPARHGIVANYRIAGSSSALVLRPIARCHRSDQRLRAQRSPYQLLASTLADELSYALSSRPYGRYCPEGPVRHHAHWPYR